MPQVPPPTGYCVLVGSLPLSPSMIPFVAMNEEDRKWFKAYCRLILEQIARDGKCPEHVENELVELLEEYDVSRKQIKGLILRAQLEKPLEDEDVREFCERQLEILSIIPDK